MSVYVIEGGKRLEGELSIGGSKNAILPIIAATLLNDKEVTCLKNCPKIDDVKVMVEILNELGCKADWQDDTLVIDTRTLSRNHIDEGLVKKMRSSIILLGALLGRLGEATISSSGCNLGARPIDLHLSGLRKLGVEIVEESDIISCKTKGLKGAEINLTFPSVGATQNIMLAATKAEGTTIINNAAREPEIIDLADFINACGGCIIGAGSEKIIVQGVKEMTAVTYRVIPDRIITGTYLVAAAITRGNVILNDVNSGHLIAVIDALRQMGCKIIDEKTRLVLESPKELNSIDIVTEPYPYFPTDMQSQFMALLCTANGNSVIKEKLFESRFKIASDLNRMGANIIVNGTTAYVEGGKSFVGKHVSATDLRGGAALVLAGLIASGETVVDNIKYIKRGYENIVTDLSKLGAQIEERE